MATSGGNKCPVYPALPGTEPTVRQPLDAAVAPIFVSTDPESGHGRGYSGIATESFFSK